MSKIEDLNKALFDQLERLSNTENMKNPIALEREVKRASAITSVSKQIIDVAKTELGFMKQLGIKKNHFTSEEHSVEPLLEEASKTPLMDSPSNDSKKERAKALDQELLSEKEVIKGNSLEGKIPLEIDSKTTIWIKKGTDPEEARKKYFENLSKRKY